ncbi:MAG: tetratricopeptide repeat protein [Candidatus Bathyarchaeota archaeon]|nr:tetratricopeptide repeat protein [Candidatus Bathyarchaeota archaeon]
MKTAHTIKDMQKFWREGDYSFHQGNLEGSIDSYNKALKLCQSLPECERCNHRRFEASCYAGLSASLGRLGKHLESFAAANKALVFYDEYGEKYPADTGRWLMAQVNQGTALAALGCLPAALEALGRAKEIFINRGLDIAENKQWIEMVDGNIAAIKAHMAKEER